MKFRLAFIFIALSLLLSKLAFAQKTEGDTIPYKVSKYDNKKAEKVFVIAQKLGVDPNTIVKLNKLRSIEQILVAGQRIKVPVYRKGYVYTPEQVVVHKPADLESGKINMADEDFNSTLPTKFFDPDAEQTKLMMIDASLELNLAMMQGLQASFDSLNVEDNAGVNEKDINATLRRMKRLRDRALLTPYLENIRDSLTQEIAVLTNEKEVLETKLNPPVAVIIEEDTMVSGSDVVIYSTKIFEDNRPAEQTVTSVTVKDNTVTKNKVSKAEAKRNEQREKKLREYYALDTVIVYDLPSSAKTITPTPEKHLVNEPVRTISQTWSKAQALNPISDTAAFAEAVNLNEAVKDKSVISQDTIIVDPIEEQPIAKRKAEPAEKTQAVVKEKNKEVLSKAELKKESAAQNAMAMAIASDSIKKIKAEFFLKRSQKAMAEKNIKNAEQYLLKSIELYPTYFDAWYALAEMENLFGSQPQALKEYKTCEKIDSTQPRLYISLGNLYDKMKRKTDAYNAYSKAIEIQANNIPALMARATILTDWKKYDASIDDYNQVLKTDRLYHYAYKARGLVKILNRDFKTAIDDFTFFLIFEETDPSAFYYRGLAKVGNNELLEGCLDLSTSAGMGYVAAEKAIKKSCE